MIVVEFISNIRVALSSPMMLLTPAPWHLPKIMKQIHGNCRCHQPWSISRDLVDINRCKIRNQVCATFVEFQMTIGVAWSSLAMFFDVGNVSSLRIMTV